MHDVLLHSLNKRGNNLVSGVLGNFAGSLFSVFCIFVLPDWCLTNILNVFTFHSECLYFLPFLVFVYDFLFSVDTLVSVLAALSALATFSSSSTLVGLWALLVLAVPSDVSSRRFLRPPSRSRRCVPVRTCSRSCPRLLPACGRGPPALDVARFSSVLFRYRLSVGISSSCSGWNGRWRPLGFSVLPGFAARADIPARGLGSGGAQPVPPA